MRYQAAPLPAPRVSKGFGRFAQARKRERRRIKGPFWPPQSRTIPGPAARAPWAGGPYSRSHKHCDFSRFPRAPGGRVRALGLRPGGRGGAPRISSAPGDTPRCPPGGAGAPPAFPVPGGHPPVPPGGRGGAPAFPVPGGTPPGAPQGVAGAPPAFPVPGGTPPGAPQGRRPAVAGFSSQNDWGVLTFVIILRRA